MQPASLMDSARTSHECTGLYVCFLYTVCPSESFGLLLTWTSEKSSELFYSTSIMDLMFGWMLFLC
jgi:hypothetical protein